MHSVRVAVMLCLSFFPISVCTLVKYIFVVKLDGQGGNLVECGADTWPF